MKFPKLRPDAAALHRLCTSLALRIERGEQKGRTIARLSRRHSGRRLPNRTVLKLSPATLFRHFARWREHRSAQSFTWNYRAGGQPSTVTAGLKRELIAACGAPGVFSVVGAVRELKRAHGKNSTPSQRSFYRALSRAELAEVRRFHDARRKWKAAQLRFAQFERRRGR